MATHCHHPTLTRWTKITSKSVGVQVSDNSVCLIMRIKFCTWKQVEQCSLRLIPFALAITVYAIFVQFKKSGQAWTAVTKCSPIIALMLFILFFGFTYLKSNAYPRRILMGLIFSCAGDAFLDLDFFEFGIGMFLLAQISYIFAFGFKPFKWWIGVLLFIYAAFLCSILFEHLNPFCQLGFPIYGFFLTSMAWRALARMWILDNGSVLITRLICGGSSLFFVLSDSFIAINKFYVKIPHPNFYIMITYYIAQFGIALSVIPPNGLDFKKPLHEAKQYSRTVKTSKFLD